MSFRAHPSFNARKDVTQQSWDQTDFPQNEIPTMQLWFFPSLRADTILLRTLSTISTIYLKMAWCALAENNFSGEGGVLQGLVYQLDSNITD